MDRTTTAPRTERSGGRSRGPRRRWTRLGTVGAGAHVFYELAVGVGMPFASRIGLARAAVLWGLGSVVAYRAAGSASRDHDAAFAVLNGVYLSAVIGHVGAWPRRPGTAVPWLVECEGIDGAAIHPYNVILHVSGVAAVGGLVEARRGRTLGLLLPIALVPLMVREQHREVELLRQAALDHPAWWNRRLRRARP